MMKNQNPVSIALKIHEERTGGFKIRTDRAFYARLGINPKRFALLLRGDLEITLNEACRVADVFGVSLNELLPVQN